MPEQGLDANEPAEDADDAEYDPPLFSRPGPKLGQDVKTVAWPDVRRRKQYINRYEKKSTARYRLESFADSAEYKDELPVSEEVSNHKNRYGDRRLNDTNKRSSRNVIFRAYSESRGRVRVLATLIRIWTSSIRKWSVKLPSAGLSPIFLYLRTSL
jgi:hypothetical protein